MSEEPSPAIDVRPITAAETYPLRLAVLRPNGPDAAAEFLGDDTTTTKHFGAFDRDELVGIVSLFLAEMPGRPGVSALQLRGMATAAQVRGRGFGRALVVASVAHARNRGMSLIWCNARTSALEFYRKQKWEIVGEEFEIPGVGPHFHMWRALA
jgi:GNAT superfamily N-acetyltransferase